MMIVAFFVFVSCYSFFINNINVLGEPVDVPVNVECLGKICYGISECDSKTECDDDACGPFRITYDQWVDSGSPTYDDLPSTKHTSFVKCATNYYCSTFTIQEYMKEYKTDCNHDGKIDCDDYFAIHIFGSDKCERKIPNDYKERYTEYQEKYLGLNIKSRFSL